MCITDIQVFEMTSLKNSFKNKLITYTPYLIILVLIGSSFTGMAWKVGTDSSGQVWGWINNDQGYITSTNGKAYANTQAGLQAAITATTGGTVYLSYVNITITSSIIINHAITIQGSHAPFRSKTNGSTVHNGNILGAPAFNITISGSPEHTVKFQSMQISGNPCSGEGIWCENVAQLIIDDCAIYGNGKDGVKLKSSYVVHISNSDIRTNWRAGINITGGSKATIDACHLGSNQNHGDIYVISGYATISKCYFEHYQTTTASHLNLSGLASGAQALVSDCIFYSTFTPASVSAVFIDDGDWASIENSYFVENLHGIDCRGSLVKAVNNKFRLSNSVCIMIDDSSNSYLSGNDIYVQTGSVPAMEGISVSSDSDYCKILGNTIHADALSTGDGIIVFGDYCTISDNSLYYFSDGVNLKSTSNNNSLSNNIFTGCTRMVTDDGNDSGNNFCKVITNSLGLTYPVSQVGLQQSIWDLNSSGGGWVELPTCNITISSTIYIGNNTWLRGTGYSSILYLESNANITMIKNYGGRNWLTQASAYTNNYNIHISDLQLNGNGANQPHFYLVSNRPKLINGILFRGINNCLIENVYVRNMDSGGIVLSKGVNNTIKNCNVENSGVGFYGTAKTNYWSCGITLDDISFSVVRDCRVTNSYSIGILMQSIDVTGVTLNTSMRGNVIDSCYIEQAEMGIYSEVVRDAIITNCIVKECNNEEVYGTPSGIYASTPMMGRLTISSCTVSQCGKTDGSAGANYKLNGWGITVSSSTSEYSYRTGFYLSGYNSTIVSSRSIRDNREGIYAEGFNCTITNNKISYSGDDGISFLGYYNPIISENHITGAGDYGIYSYDSAARRILNRGGSISNNVIISPTDIGIYNYLYNVSINGNAIYGGPTGIDAASAWCSINNNVISGCTSFGINTEIGNCTIIGNVIGSCPTEGIRISTASKNNTVTGNRIFNTNQGIHEYSGFNIITNNDVKGCTSGLVVTGTSSIRRDNLGYVTESWGVKRYTLTNNSIIVTHNLSAIPTNVQVSMKTAIGFILTVTSVGTTSFVVNIKHYDNSSVANPGHLINWYAKV